MSELPKAPKSESPVDGIVVLFSAAVFLSAFLLFQVQPLIGKAILPWFGGTPGVWTTCMLFFQMLLCGGYLYSHMLTGKIPRHRQGQVHVTLLIVSLLLLQILPDASWKPTGAEPPVLRILALLLSTVGLPYFTLSTTGPLLLRWFSEVRPSASPYRLYALSNAGSLLALLSYPFVFEPTMRLTTQANSWTLTYVVFCFLCFFAARSSRRTDIIGLGDSSSSMATGSTAEASKESKPSKAQRTRLADAKTAGGAKFWFVLSMIASWMLLAETNEVCQDVAVIPFLWVVPLSLYLLSFILCFESDRWYRRKLFSVATAVFVLAVCWLQSFGTQTHLPLQLFIYFGCLFCICMLCHGELARLRPSADRLTAFYLTLSAGGAAGGLFVGVVAPAVFPAFWEHDLGMMAVSVLAMIVLLDAIGSATHRRPPLSVAIPFIGLLVATGTMFAAAVTNYTESIAMTRNFYGVLEVEHDDIEDATVMRHGRILHGLQLRSNPRLPTMYYGYNSGVGLAISELSEARPELRVGLVGLGAGTLATYGRGHDEFRFYEINDAVTQLAKSHFTFLSDTRAKIDIVPGDARLVLEQEASQEFDLLVLDAFSGDAIPTHLLTTEAMQVYLRHLKKDGLLAFHISNLHFDLRRVTESLASDAELQLITLETRPMIDSQTGAAMISDPGSRWVLMSRDALQLERPRYQSTKVQEPLPAAKRVRWTDDFSNLIEVMYW